MKTIKIQREDVWTVEGHEDPPRVVLKNLDNTWAFSTRPPDDGFPEPVIVALASEWERVRPLEPNRWRDDVGDIAEFRRNPETKMPEAGWVKIAGRDTPMEALAWWSPEGLATTDKSDSQLSAALLAWARENPAEREGSVVGDHGISLKVKWIGDRLTCGTITKDVDEHLLSDLLWVETLRANLRAWIAQTRPEMLPPVEPATEPQSVDKPPNETKLDADQQNLLERTYAAAEKLSVPPGTPADDREAAKQLLISLTWAARNPKVWTDLRVLVDAINPEEPRG